MRRFLRTRSTPILGILLGLFAVPGCLARSGADPAPGATRDEWYRLILNGQPAGFSREVQRNGTAGNLVTEVRQRLTVLRGKEPMTMEVESRIEEAPDGRILGFRLVQKWAASDDVMEGVVQGDRLAVTARGSGKPREFSKPHDPRARGPRHLEKLIDEKLTRPGDTVTAVAFFPEKCGCGTASTTLGAEEEIPFPGGPRRLVRRTTRIDILPGTDMVEWVDRSGKVWKTSTPLPGMSLETYLSSAEEILKEKYASPPEIFYSTSIRPGKPPRNPAGAQEVVYRLALKKGEFGSLGIEGMFRGTGQEVLREESPSARVVRVSRVLPGRSVRRPVAAPPGSEDTLAPSIYIQSDDPLIADLARKAVGDETDAFEAARKIERWVKANMNFKDLKTAFASARETAEKLEGDCTEHGLLLAAMARASGIPARVVSGLVWYGDVYVGHLWTEVWIDRWVPLDGTRGRGEVGPDHLAIAASPLAGGSAADLFLQMVQVIGNLEIDVLSERG